MSGYAIVPGRGKVKNNDFLSSMGCICYSSGSKSSSRPSSSYEKGLAEVESTGNKWQIENFKATHNP